MTKKGQTPNFEDSKKLGVCPKALNYAYLLLKYRPRSQAEIVLRLKRKKYSSSVIGKVIAHLLKCGYLNDAEFTRVFVSSGLNRAWGLRKIKAGLEKFGIISGLDQLDLDQDLLNSKLEELVAKKLNLYKRKKTPYISFIRYLVSRGFTYSQASQAVKKAGVKS